MPNLVSLKTASRALPAIVAEADDVTRERFFEFFASTIHNPQYPAPLPRDRAGFPGLVRDCQIESRLIHLSRNFELTKRLSDKRAYIV
jgi:hypothetical protein